MSDTLVTALQNSALYDHPIREFKMIETHISWVILTGQYVYKIKKPVNFGFLDFSTLEKRKHYCYEELRLNKALAPDIYEQVIPIRGSIEHPQLDNGGEIIEYALKMREFNQENLLSRLLEKNQLMPRHIFELAKTIAKFHQDTACVPNDLPFGTPEQVHGPVQQNFEQIAELLRDENDLAQMRRIQAWADQQYQQLYSVLAERRTQGFIRECHGDIHLGNIVLQANGQPTLFDCIEFNDEFRWTDVMADLGFIAMDLQDHERDDYAHLLINAYLEHTGDYQGLAVLPYYLSYRAMVRAKVALFRLQQPNLTAEAQHSIRKQYASCMALAERYMTQAQPALMITQGLSGSGKSSVSRRVVEHFGAIQIRSDVERKRLHGMTADMASHSALNSHLYAPNNTEKTYHHLAALARIILQANYPVVVDATFLKVQQRQLFAELARQLNIPFIILHCHAPVANLQTILQKRLAKNRDASEATLEVLEMQQTTAEPLTAEEKSHEITIDTSKGREVQAIALEQIKKKLKG